MSKHTETSAKPTPGPWHAFTPFGKSWSDHGYRMVAQVRSGDNLRIYAESANMHQEGRGFVWGDLQADARVLSASISLFETGLDMMADAITDEAQPGFVLVPNEAWTAFRAALAKAQGGESC